MAPWGLIFRCLAAWLLLTQEMVAALAIVGTPAADVSIYATVVHKSLALRTAPALTAGTVTPALKLPIPSGPTAALQPASGPIAAAAAWRRTRPPDRPRMRELQERAFWARGPPGRPRSDARRLS